MTDIIRFIDRRDRLSLHCGSNVINEVDSCKYLGLVIDNELKWTSHIDLSCHYISNVFTIKAIGIDGLRVSLVACHVDLSVVSTL
jgi:hypothetical protein